MIPVHQIEHVMSHTLEEKGNKKSIASCTFEKEERKMQSLASCILENLHIFFFDKDVAQMREI